MRNSNHTQQSNTNDAFASNTHSHAFVATHRRGVQSTAPRRRSIVIMAARPPRVQVTLQQVQSAPVDEDSAMSAASVAAVAAVSSSGDGVDDPDWLDHVRARVHGHLDDFLRLSLIERIAQMAFIRCIWVHLTFIILILGVS